MINEGDLTVFDQRGAVEVEAIVSAQRFAALNDRRA
jgi:hypothetical protein